MVHHVASVLAGAAVLLSGWSNMTARIVRKCIFAQGRRLDSTLMRCIRCVDASAAAYGVRVPCLMLVGSRCEALQSYGASKAG
jgi:hypothetical protein